METLANIKTQDIIKKIKLTLYENKKWKQEIQMFNKHKIRIKTLY